MALSSFTCLHMVFPNSLIFKKYKSCNLGNLRYLAMVIESDDAHQVSKVVELLRWLESLEIGRAHV